MARFGESIILRNNVVVRGKIKFIVLGLLDVGYFLRSKYFIKFIKINCVKSRLGRKSEIAILDAGCGNGDYSFYLAERYRYSQIDACDINETILSENRLIQEKLRLSNINFFKKDLIRLDIKEKYDFVFCIGVIIYMNPQENDLIFRNLYNSLKKSGVMYLYLAHRDWENSVMISSKFYRMMYEQAKKQNSGFLYDEKELPLLLSKTGFRIIKQRITGGFWGELSWEIDQILKECRLERIRLILLPFLKSLSLIDMFVGNNKGTGMIFLLEKNSGGMLNN